MKADNLRMFISGKNRSDRHLQKESSQLLLAMVNIVIRVVVINTLFRKKKIDTVRKLFFPKKKVVHTV